MCLKNLILTVILVGTVVSQAAMGWDIYTINGGSDSLTIINSSNGMATNIGPVGFSAWSWGLSFNPVPVPSPSGKTFPVNTLFGVETNTDSLYYFDLNSGQANLIGSLGTSFAESLAFSSNGTLYTSDGQDLYTVNTNTGAASFVVTLLGHEADGLSFSPVPVPGPGGSTIPAGTLFGMDTGALFTIDVDTGVLTLIGSGLGDESIAFSPNGTLYGFGVEPCDLYQISTVDGSGIYIGSPGLTQLWSAAIIPEPGTICLLGLGSLLICRSKKFNKKY